MTEDECKDVCEAKPGCVAIDFVIFSCMTYTTPQFPLNTVAGRTYYERSCNGKSLIIFCHSELAVCRAIVVTVVVHW